MLTFSARAKLLDSFVMRGIPNFGLALHRRLGLSEASVALHNASEGCGLARTFPVWVKVPEMDTQLRLKPRVSPG